MKPLQTKTSQSQPSLSKIKDSTTSANQGIILIQQSAIQDVYEKSKPLSKSNEFQVHYWFLNLRFRGTDNSILDIAIPTCYFNYKQEVSGARIDFELTDVIAMSDKVQPLHNMKVNEILKSDFIDNLQHTIGVVFETSSQNYGSLHRHPGGSHQSFSGTDLDKNPTDHGVVYPLQTAENDTPNFAGIMYIANDRCDIAHYEYRTANGTLGTDLAYIKGGCTAIVLSTPSPVSAAQALLGQHDEPYTIHTNNCSETPLIHTIKDLFSLSQFQPSTHAISGEFLSQRASTFKWPTAKSQSLFAQPKPTEPDIIAKYKDLDVSTEDKIRKMNSKAIIKVISRLALAYWDDAPKYTEGYIADLEDMTKPDLIEEYIFIHECIIDEYNEAITAEKFEDPALDYYTMIKETLINLGYTKSVVESWSDAKLEDTYDKLPI